MKLIGIFPLNSWNWEIITLYIHYFICIKRITFQKVLHRTPVVKNESHVAVFLQLVKR